VIPAEDYECRVSSGSVVGWFGLIERGRGRPTDREREREG